MNTSSEVKQEFYGRLWDLTPALKNLYRRPLTFVAYLAMPERYLGEAFRREQWQKIYDANPCLAKHGILFDTFIQAPEQILQALVFGRSETGPNEYLQDDAGFYPPLTEQLLAAERGRVQEMEREYLESLEQKLIPERDCRMRDNRYIEPLHHHAYAVSSDRVVSRER